VGVDEEHDDLEPRRLDALGYAAVGPVGQVVDRGHVEAQPETVLVAQGPHELDVLLDGGEGDDLATREGAVALDEHAVPPLRLGPFGRGGLGEGLGVAHHGLAETTTGVAPDVCPSRWPTWISAPPPVAPRRRVSSPLAITWCRVRMACWSVSGPGGQPGAYTSTGTIWSTP
jgi:hypothetical protein